VVKDAKRFYPHIHIAIRAKRKKEKGRGGGGEDVINPAEDRSRRYVNFLPIDY